MLGWAAVQPEGLSAIWSYDTPDAGTWFWLPLACVLVLGLGDSGLAMARWCVRFGAQVTVWDSRAQPPQLVIAAGDLALVFLLKQRQTLFARTPLMHMGVSVAALQRMQPLPQDAQRLLADQLLAQETFIMWDLIHDRTHMRGDLPFDPFMIKQRMPFFLYGLEELRCDLTAFRECVKLSRDTEVGAAMREHAQLVLYAVVFDRIFRFAITGNRVRNYDAVAGQLLLRLETRGGDLDLTGVGVGACAGDGAGAAVGSAAWLRALTAGIIAVAAPPCSVPASVRLISTPRR